MVRLLTVEQFGEYRDFLLYGAMLFTIVEFSVHGSLAYFIPRDPSRERVYFTQASLFVLATSTVAALLVVALGHLMPSEVIRQYKYALGLYTLFLCNLDAWEVYWIAKKQTLNVLRYSLTRLMTRTIIVILAAFLSRSVSTVIYTLVIFEAARLAVMTAYAANKRIFTSALDVVTVRAHLAFFGPLGASNILYTANVYMGQLYISAVMGPAMLALYTIGTYLQPIIYVFRSSIGDVIMPEIASKHEAPVTDALVLWQRATVLYCAVMMPMTVLLYYYADVFVSVLFTDSYLAAIPVFQVFVLLLVRECFDFSLPLRIVNRTRTLFYATVGSVVANLLLMLVLFDIYGLVGPALAVVVSRMLVSVVLGGFVMKYCGYSLGGLLRWTDISKIVVLCFACLPILLLGDAIEIHPMLRAAAFTFLYSLTYVGLLAKVGIDDVGRLIAKVLRRR